MNTRSTVYASARVLLTWAWIWAWICAAPSACAQPVTCTEDLRAQILDETLDVTMGDALVSAELADTKVERERGWRHRRCDMGALLLVPDQPGTELPIWGCGLTQPIDAGFVRDAEIVAIERIEPCPEPCGSCEILGAGITVDAVLELPAGTQRLSLGAAVDF